MRGHKDLGRSALGLWKGGGGGESEGGGGGASEGGGEGGGEEEEPLILAANGFTGWSFIWMMTWSL